MTTSAQEQNTNMNMINGTPYDDAFRTMTKRCPGLLIPVVNKMFGKNYGLDEEIVMLSDETFPDDTAGGILRRISDDFFSIGHDNPEKYVIECQSTSDTTIIVRIFQYITSLAIEGGEIKDNTLSIHIPAAGILYLRSTRNTPDQMNIRISTIGSSMEFTVPVLKVKNYNLINIFKEKLLFLLPFYMFNYENRFSLYEKDEDARIQLLNEMEGMVRALDDLTERGEITQFERITIIFMFNHVVKNLARKHERILKGVNRVMGGKILEYEAYNIYSEGIKEGKIEGKIEGKKEGIIEGIIEGKKEGIKEGETKFGKLMLVLLSNGLTSDMEKAATDINARKELYKKYKIDDAE